MICGSMTFAREMLNAKEVLEGMGHSVKIPTDALLFVGGDLDNDDLEKDYRHCVENDIIRTHFKLVEESDAVLVLNHDKNGVSGYIGVSTIMEIGLAHHFHKKIFLLQDVPHHSQWRWAHEVRIMQPVVLNGNISAIK